MEGGEEAGDPLLFRPETPISRRRDVGIQGLGSGLCHFRVERFERGNFVDIGRV